MVDISDHGRDRNIITALYQTINAVNTLSIIAEIEEWLEPEGDELEILSMEERK